MPSIDLLKASRNPQKDGSFLREKAEHQVSKGSLERSP